MKPLVDLLKFGFVEAGKWKLNGKDLTFDLSNKKLEKEQVVYAFVSRNRVAYIGVCHKKNRSLKARMGSYKYKSGGSTNSRVAKLIKRRKGAVKIFALLPQAVRKYKNVKVDLVNGLENPLLKKLDPPWNKQK